MPPKRGKVELKGDDMLHGDKSKSEGKLEVTVQEKHDENSALSNDQMQQAPPAGIYWTSFFTMVGNFLCGCGCAVALHGYYSSLNHNTVGNYEDQSTSLRYENFLKSCKLYTRQSCRLSTVMNIKFSMMEWRRLVYDHAL